MKAISRHYLGGERRERAAKRLPEQLCKPSMDARPLSSPVGYGPRQLSKHLWRHLTPSLHRSNLSLLSSHVSAHIPQLSRLAANLPLLSPHQWDASKQKDRILGFASFSFHYSFQSLSSAVLLKGPHCGLWTALKPLEYTACLLSGRNKTQKHSMPRRVCDGVKCYIYSCQRLMLSATILHGPTLHAHSAPTQFYSRTT